MLFLTYNVSFPVALNCLTAQQNIHFIYSLRSSAPEKCSDGRGLSLIYTDSCR